MFALQYASVAKDDKSSQIYKMMLEFLELAAPFPGGVIREQRSPSSFTDASLSYKVSAIQHGHRPEFRLTTRVHVHVLTRLLAQQENHVVFCKSYFSSTTARTLARSAPPDERASRLTPLRPPLGRAKSRQSIQLPIAQLDMRGPNHAGFQAQRRPQILMDLGRRIVAHDEVMAVRVLHLVHGDGLR